jgi:hypothetical protein
MFDPHHVWIEAKQFEASMKIKIKVLNGLVTAAFGAFVVSGAYATNIVLDYGSAHSGVGGEFVVKSDGSAASTTFINATVANYSSLATYQGGFETFCIEYNEHFSPGSAYNYQISPAAIKGGTATGDPVSAGTGYLYSLFAKGLLASYVPAYSYSSASGAANLQNTFWFLENETIGLGGTPIVDPGTFDSLLIAEFGSLANAMLDTATSADFGLVNAASFGVAALNMGPAPTFPNQDQLIYQGGGFQVADGGTTLMLLGLAMGGMSLLRRKLA